MALLTYASNYTAGWNSYNPYTDPFGPTNNTGFTSVNNTPCSNYSSLFEFSFQVSWQNTMNSQYLTVPLSTFASTNS